MERLTWLSAKPNTRPSSASANSSDYNPKRAPWAINWSPPMCPRIPQPRDQELAIMFLRRTAALQNLRNIVRLTGSRSVLECGSPLPLCSRNSHLFRQRFQLVGIPCAAFVLGFFADFFDFVRCD